MLTSNDNCGIVFHDLFDEVLCTGGATIAYDGTHPTEGYVVSSKPEACHRLSDETFFTYFESTVSDFIQTNYQSLAHGSFYLGIWIDDSIAYLDLVQVCASREEAETLGRAANQQAIYNLVSCETIYL